MAKLIETSYALRRIKELFNSETVKRFNVAGNTFRFEFKNGTALELCGGTYDEPSTATYYERDGIAIFWANLS